MTVGPVFAAGSLREAFGAIAGLWRARGGGPVETVFGAAGLLRERIERGEAADVFASADLHQPRRLAAHADWSEPVVFARNTLCAIVAPQVPADSERLLGALLDERVRVGMSTPGCDPSGDYVMAMFSRADALSPGASARLAHKALRLTGSPQSPKGPPGRGTYSWIMESGQADAFITYRSSAMACCREWPEARLVELPPALQVTAEYGISVRSGAPAAALRFAEFLREASAQAMLSRFGFGAA